MKHSRALPNDRDLLIELRQTVSQMIEQMLRLAANYTKIEQWSAAYQEDGILTPPPWRLARWNGTQAFVDGLPSRSDLILVYLSEEEHPLFVEFLKRAESIENTIDKIGRMLLNDESFWAENVNPDDRGDDQHSTSRVREFMAEAFAHLDAGAQGNLEEFKRHVWHAVSILRMLEDRIFAKLNTAATGNTVPDKPPTPKAVESKHLDLQIDLVGRKIRRNGLDAVVDLSGRPTLWETFQVFYAAGTVDASEADWKQAYKSGEWTAKRQTVAELRIQLIPLGVTVPGNGRRIIESSDV